jgi:hypothetical protein
MLPSAGAIEVVKIGLLAVGLAEPSFNFAASVSLYKAISASRQI